MDLKGYECLNTDMRIVGTCVVGPKGQVVIPKDVRDAMGIESGTTLVVALKFFNGKPVGMGLVKNDIMQDFINYISSEVGK